MRQVASFEYARDCKPVQVLKKDQPKAIWLMSYGALGADDYPPDIQRSPSQRQNDQEAALITLQAIKALSRRDNIPSEKARFLLTKTKDGKGRDQYDVASDVSELLGDDKGDALLKSLFSFVEPTSRKEAYDNRVANLMVTNRFLYSLVVKTGCTKGVGSLEVYPTTFSIMAGDRFKFSGGYITVSKNVPVGSEFLPINDDGPELSAKDVGFLCEPESSLLEVGNPGWDSTHRFLDYEKDALYEFFVSENQADRQNLGEAEEEPGESPAENGSPSTGKKSTPDSTTSAAKSRNSKAVKALAGSPSG